MLKKPNLLIILFFILNTITSLNKLKNKRKGRLLWESCKHRDHTSEEEESIKKFKIIYKERFRALKNENEGNAETLEVLESMEKEFDKKFKFYANGIKSVKIEIGADDNISSYANAHNYDEDMGAHTYGMKTGQDVSKILISGARGSKKKVENETEINTLGITEIIEEYQTGISAAFASKTANGQYFIDAKVNKENEDFKINAKGQLEISYPIAKKYIIHSSKTALGTTKIYRLLVGLDYLQLIETFLMSGATVKDDCVLSKSSISVKIFLTCDKDEKNPKIKVHKNLGFFSSENKTDYERSVSNHIGYLMIDKESLNDKLKKEELTTAHASADKNGTSLDATYKSRTTAQGNK